MFRPKDFFSDVMEKKHYKIGIRRFDLVGKNFSVIILRGQLFVFLFLFKLDYFSL